MLKASLKSLPGGLLPSGGMGTGQAGRGRTVERETHDLGHFFRAMCFLRAPGSNRVIG